MCLDAEGFAIVDRLASGARPGGIAALNAKVLLDTMENSVAVVSLKAMLEKRLNMHGVCDSNLNEISAGFWALFWPKLYFHIAVGRV